MTSYPNFDPTALFAGEGPYRHRPVSVGGGQGVLPRGTLLGRKSVGAVAAAAGANTGNGTVTQDASTPTLANAQPGAYAVKFTTATAYGVYDPKGNYIGSGAVGTAFANQLKFNIAAGGTAFVAGDSFTLTVANPDTYVVSKASAIDGSQVPSAIVAYDIDTSAGAVSGPCYFEGEFTAEVMTIDPSWSLSGVRAAIRQNDIPLYLRSAGQLG